MSVSTPKAELGGTIIDCLVYGLYLSIFVRSVEVLSLKETYSRSSTYLYVTTVVLFCLITAHLGLDVDRAFRAFTGNTETPHFPEGYFNILSGAEALAKNSAYVTITLIADFFLIFRCFVAFGHNYFVVIIPSLLYIGNLVTACLALVTFKRAEDASGGKAIVAEVISRVKYMYVCTLALNLWCTLSIAVRIWLVQRKSAAVQVSGRRALGNVTTIIVESAAIYSVFTIILIGSASYQSALMYAVLNPMPSIIGVVFSSIIVRVSSGRSFTTARQPPRSALEFRQSRNPTSERTMGTVQIGGSILPTTNVHLQLSGSSGVHEDADSRDK